MRARRFLRLLANIAGNEASSKALYRVGNLFNDERLAFWHRKLRYGAREDLACLKELLPFVPSRQEVESLLTEIDSKADFLRETILNYISPEFVKTFDEKFYTVGLAGKLFLYVLTRLMKPEIVVETGCAKGQTSFYLLLAMEMNNRGRLYTVDLPLEPSRNDGIWTVKEPGVMVPQNLRYRWTLILGDAYTELIPLLEKLRKIDLFYHDSDHSYTHMMLEYTAVWPHLADGGIMVSDDITLNTAFLDFCTAMKVPLVVHPSNVNCGALRKSFAKGKQGEI